MKNNKTVDRIQAVWNKLGGEEGVDALLRGNIELKKRTIDLSKPPRTPSEGFEVVKHESTINGKSVVEIELRDDNLYIDGCKVDLFLSNKQEGDGRVRGYGLRKELENGKWVLLNSNVLDYLLDHPKLYPEHFKKDENGETRYIFFWGSISRDPLHDYLYVRYMYWNAGELHKRSYWLDGVWDRQNPSAILAS